MGKILSFGAFAYGAAGRLSKGLALILALLASPVRADEVVVAALGDSLTQGYGLAQSDGFVPQMEAWLRDQGAQVRLINAGVSGDTTAGGLSRIDWTLTPEVAGVIIALGGNDLLRGIDPAVSRENLRQIIEKAQARGARIALVGMQAIGNYGPDFKKDFDAMYPDLAKEYDLYYIDSFLAGLRAETPAQARGLMQADGIHPNAEGVALVVAEMGPKLLPMLRDLGACPEGC